MISPFELTALSDAHDRRAFCCGQSDLDRYFQTQVTQDIHRRIATCFVAIDRASGQVAAFYTIATASIPTPDLPAEITKRLPRYPTLPAVRIGRLAVDQNFRGRGLGAGLLADAFRRVLMTPPAVFAVIVDAKDDEAVAFYVHHGFQRLAGHKRTLFLPAATAEKLLL